MTELAEGAARAAEALAPDEGEGATGLTAAAERALAPLERLAPELARVGEELRDLELRLGEVGSDLRGVPRLGEAEPDRLEHVEGELERISDAPPLRRSRLRRPARTGRRGARRARSARGGPRPGCCRGRDARGGDRRATNLAAELRAAREAAADAFADAVAGELRGVGMGDGEFRVELRERDPGQSGADEAVFLIRPNGGLPFGPVAETASGGEPSASRSRSPPLAAARRWYSTRSMPASGVRPRTLSPRR